MYREDLLIKINNTALFRSQKAEEYPEDPRNAQAAAELRELKEYISGLPDDHPLIMALEKVDADGMCRAIQGSREPDHDALFRVVECENDLLQRIGFDGRAGPEGIVQGLIECYTPEQEV